MIAQGPKAPVSISDTFDSIRADYNMSRESRFIRRRTGLPAQGDSADWHYRSESLYYRDIEKARDMDRNDSIVGQTIDRAVTNIVQGGFTLDTKTGDKKLDADLKQRWQAWANDPDDCDIAGESCFHDYELQSCRGMLVDGDCVNLGLDSGHLQHLEAHTIQTSGKVDDTFLGVTKDKYGKRLRYWVQQDDQTHPTFGRGVFETAKPVDVRNEAGLRNLFHVYAPKRMSQTRGITAFAPIFELTGMFEDIQFAKLVQQQVVSCFAIFRQKSTNGFGGGGAGYGDGSTETTSAGQRYIENITPGMEIIGEPGETLQGFSPNTPNAEYFAHVRLMMQMIGVNLGLPLCLVLMDGSETNFSGWRGAVDEARKGFRLRQRNLVKRFHSPLYRWKVAQWIAKDSALRKASEKRNVFAHNWQPPTWQYIEPVKDAQGDILRLSAGLTSRRRLHAEREGDWEEIADEQIEDNAYAISSAIKRAERINKKLPDGTAKIHWRELIQIPMADGIQMSLQDPQLIAATENKASENE